MLPCPRCRIPLQGQRGGLGVHYVCARCSGRAANVSLLRRELTDSFMDRLWVAVLDAPDSARSQDVACPSCAKKMVEVAVDVEEGKPFALDVCQHCQFLWMDGGEYERLPGSSRQEQERELEDRLPLEVRQRLAVDKVRRMREQEDAEQVRSTGPPGSMWETLVTVFGFPIEENPPATREWPMMTWTVAALCVLATAVAYLSGDPAQVFQIYGFKPWALTHFELGRAILTSITSFFLHGGVLHLLGNLWFLLLVGDNVEESLGKRRFLLVLVLSAFLGDMAHWILVPHSQIPMIGASGGISGLMVYYALRFPQTRLVFWVFWVWWIRLRAWSAILLWLGVQVYFASRQLGGEGGVSFLAHLGGAFGGLLGWWVTRAWDARPESVEDSPRREKKSLRGLRDERDKRESGGSLRERREPARETRDKDKRRKSVFFGGGERKRRKKGGASKRAAADLWGERRR